MTDVPPDLAVVITAGQITIRATDSRPLTTSDLDAAIKAIRENREKR